MKALTPADVTSPAGLSAYSALPSVHPTPNHVMPPLRRFLRHSSAQGGFRASP